MLFEMNRIGMLVEISHLSEAGMVAALRTAKAPVLLMNSAPASFCNGTNVASIPDRVLRYVVLALLGIYELYSLMLLSFSAYFRKMEE